MLSFVVQNFYLNNSITRTKKYNALIFLRSVGLFFLFFKNYTHMVFYKQAFTPGTLSLFRIFNKNFIRPFWTAIAFIDDFRYGLYTNNLSKSLTWHTLKTLLTGPGCGSVNTQPQPFTKVDYPLRYIQHIPTLSFPFKGSIYNNVIVYFLYFITKTYVPAKQQFNLMYNFILLPKVFSLYMFCNSFYFRIWNY